MAAELADDLVREADRVAAGGVTEGDDKSRDQAEHLPPPDPPSDDREPNWTEGEIVTVIADQYWMHRHLDGRRIDLTELSRFASGGHPADPIMVVPDIPALEGFIAAARDRGWTVEVVKKRTSRVDQIKLAREVVDGAGALAIISGFRDFVAALEATTSAGKVKVIDDLAQLKSRW